MKRTKNHMKINNQPTGWSGRYCYEFCNLQNIFNIFGFWVGGLGCMNITKTTVVCDCPGSIRCSRAAAQSFWSASGTGPYSTWDGGCEPNASGPAVSQGRRFWGDSQSEMYMSISLNAQVTMRVCMLGQNYPHNHQRCEKKNISQWH